MRIGTKSIQLGTLSLVSPCRVMIVDRDSNQRLMRPVARYCGLIRYIKSRSVVLVGCYDGWWMVDGWRLVRPIPKTRELCNQHRGSLLV